MDTDLALAEHNMPGMSQPIAPFLNSVGAFDGSQRFRIETAGKCLFVTNCDGRMFKFGPLMGERIVACCEGRLAAADLSQWAAAQ
jgi:hypothetical protein